MVAIPSDPRNLLSRYPALDTVERKALVAWVRSLRPGKLVTLLADRRAERKLLELRANEPEMKADGRFMDHLLVAGLLGGAAALLAVFLSAIS